MHFAVKRPKSESFFGVELTIGDVKRCEERGGKRDGRGVDL